MGIPTRKIVKLLAENDPASAEFREGVRDAMRSSAQVRVPELDLWKDRGAARFSGDRPADRRRL